MDPIKLCNLQEIRSPRLRCLGATAQKDSLNKSLPTPTVSEVGKKLKRHALYGATGDAHGMPTWHGDVAQRKYHYYKENKKIVLKKDLRKLIFTCPRNSLLFRQHSSRLVWQLVAVEDKEIY